ncbi:MAG: hypothetical protein DI622_11010 [Chryseobacterium sp.]|nr:MAG: hypothetical protein DI622_11010 [Chryseobacterium sp.]
MEKSEITPELMEKIQARIPEGKPIVMFNLLRYRDYAEYPDVVIEKISGRDAYYKNYASAFNQIVTEIGAPTIKVIYVGKVQANIISNGEIWDDVVLVKYPDFATLQSIINHPNYANKAALHHNAAIKEWSWFATTRIMDI